MFLREAAEVVNGVVHGIDTEFDSVHTDTRGLAAKALFFALRGDNFDGHDFLYAAQQAGAVAAVVQNFNDQVNLPQIVVADSAMALGHLARHWRCQFAGKVVGLTGSSGKTTVKGLLKSVFAQAGSVHATPGNWNNQIGVPLSLFGLRDQQFGVIELGTNHVGEIAYLTELVLPDVALVNNVGPAHLEGFGSIDAIAREKSTIYAQLRADQFAVINLNDAYADVMLAQTTFCRQMGFGLDVGAATIPTVTATDITFDPLGRATFSLVFAGDAIDVSLALLGAHNVRNALAAAATALAAGVDLPTVAAGLQAFAGDKGRMQAVRAKSGAHCIDDTYNANPRSVEAALDYLQQCSGRRIFVFGDMGELGDFCDQAHQQVGAYARQRKIDSMFCVGKKAALAARAFGANAFAFDDQASLIEALVGQLDENTHILIKGSRSAHMEDVVQGLREEEQTRC